MMLLVDKPLAGNSLPCKPSEAVSGHPVLWRPAPSRQIALQSPAGQWMTWHLRNECHAVNEKRIRRLMRLMRVRRENSPPDCILTLLTADLPKAQYQQVRKGAQDLSLPAGRAADRPTQSGLVRRFHLRWGNGPPDHFLILLTAHAQGRSAWPRTCGGSCLTLSGGNHGLVHRQGAGLAHLEHA